MEPSDFNRADHQQALRDFKSVAAPEGTIYAEDRTAEGAITDPWVVVHWVRADFEFGGVRLSVFKDTLIEQPALSQLLTPQAARVVAMQILDIADWSEGVTI